MGRSSDELFRCVCHMHVFSATQWGDGEVWLGWYETPGPDSWRWRLRTAWRVLRGEEHYPIDICLSGEDAGRLISVLIDASVASAPDPEGADR